MDELATTIEQLEHDLMTAVRRRDAATLERLLGDDFTLTTGRIGNEVRTRDEWMRITLSEYVIDAYEFESLVVQVYDGCAVARSRYRQRASMAGQSRNTTFRMTDVWIRSRDAWQLQARHAQPVEGD